MGVTYERVLVTPELAKRWLRSNAENQRNQKPAKIASYARDMASGAWDSDTGETIKFRGDVLIDGQNRLCAVVEAGVPIAFDVARTTSDKAMIVIDTGASRTMGDSLKIAGSHDRFRAAAILRWVALFDAGIRRGSGGTLAPTNSELWDLYAKDPALYDSAAARGADVSRVGLGTGSAAGTAYVLFVRIDRDLALRFFDDLVIGAGLPVQHPVLTLRNRLTRVRVDRIARHEQLALHIRAWNALRAGETPKVFLVTRAGELTNGNFPTPR